MCETATDWFEAKADQLGLDSDDLVHPADVDHENTEWLIGARVLQWSKPGLTNNCRDDFTVDKIEELETGDGDQTFAIYAYRQPGSQPMGMNIEINDRDNLDSWNRQARFVHPDATTETPDVGAALERLQETPSYADVSREDAIDLTRALGGNVEDISSGEGSIPIGSFLRRMVSQVTDEDPKSARDEFGHSVTGHKKRARGVYKANLRILENELN